MEVPLVKSVVRVFDILELFSARQKPMSAIEISRALDLPVTSTHAILKSMRTLNYLDHDGQKRTFYPSHSLPALFEFVRFRIEEEGNLQEFLAKLNMQTQETISLSRRIDIDAAIIFGLESIHPIGVRVREGYKWPLSETTTGACLLSVLKQDELDVIIDRMDSKSAVTASKKGRSALLQRIQKVRDDGYLVEHGMQVSGMGVVSAPIFSPVSRSVLSVSIVGPSERIKLAQSDIIALLLKLAKKQKIDLVFPSDASKKA